MKAVGNGKEIKLNKDKSCLNYSGKAFNQEGVRILEAFFFFFFQVQQTMCFFSSSSDILLLICVLIHSRNSR